MPSSAPHAKPYLQTPDPSPDTRALAGSQPLRLAIPAIGVHVSVIGLGTNPDGTARVPPLTQPMLTSWFDEGPAPGQDGPAAPAAPSARPGPA